jgi:predicted GNAT family acetyltransferase
MEPETRFNLESIVVENNDSAHRFQVEIDGQWAFLEYQLSGSRLVLVHTEVPTAISKRGLAGKIVRTSLEFARSRNLTVIPYCPFVVAYIRKHKEYIDLVASSFRDKVLSDTDK